MLMGGALPKAQRYGRVARRTLLRGQARCPYGRMDDTEVIPPKKEKRAAGREAALPYGVVVGGVSFSVEIGRAGGCIAQ